MIDRQLAKKIGRMRTEDQHIRRLAMGVGRNQRRFQKRMLVVDRKNTKEAKRIIAQYGWPLFPLVGKRAAHSFWLLVQHADHDRAFQKKCLKLMTKAAASNEAFLKDVAYLTDRLLISEAKKQKFGTQFLVKGNKLVPRPITDPHRLDQRRRAYGLDSMKTYIKHAEATFNTFQKKKSDSRSHRP